MSKRKPIIIANWKMCSRLADLKSFLSELAQQQEIDVDAVVCPSFPYLIPAVELNNASWASIGAQNVSQHMADGAYTGEVSAEMLADVGCDFVIIGHSERRAQFNERSDQIAKKFKALIAANITPIFCVGETAQQHEQKAAELVIRQQIEELVNQVGVGAFRNSIVAYEPIWAIGTGRTPSPEQIEQIHAIIRQIFKAGGVHADTELRLVYGGSVNAKNAADILTMPNVDGALVGKASLNAGEFYRIMQATV